MPNPSRANVEIVPTTSTREQGSVGYRFRAVGLICAMVVGLAVCAAGGSNASAAGSSAAHVGAKIAPRPSTPVVSAATTGTSERLAPRPTHTFWHGGEATVTGPIAAGTQLRVHAVLNSACQIGKFTNATCQPESLLGWETIIEDGIFSPVPAPLAPYGVCEGDTTVAVKGYPHIISRQLFSCFTL